MKTTQLIAAMLVALAGPGAFAQPTITRQPPNSSVSLGATAQFTVYAASPNPPITYQWWFNTAVVDTNANPSAAKYLLSLTNVTLAAAGPYFVVVGDTNGYATSQVATLTVDPTFTKITAGPVVTDKGICSDSSWGDYDNDGYADLLVPRANGKTALYHNNRDGTFSTVTNSMMPLIGGSSYGRFAWADYDNDGFLDACLFAGADGGGFYLCHNNGDGTFQSRFGLSDDVWSVAWGDYDKDGFLDLFSASVSGPNSLYHNNRDGTFTKMTAKSVGDIVEWRDWSSGASWADYDDDGLLELFVGGNGNGNGVYHLLPTGQFTLLKTNVVTSGDDFSGAWGDCDNDGLLDFAGASFSKGSVTLYHNLGQGNFKKVTLLPAGTRAITSVSWADYDNDGFLDLFVTDYPGMNRMFHNNRDGTFTAASLGSLTGERPNGLGSFKGLWMDYDNDGFSDLFVVNGSETGVGQTANFLYHNNGNSNAWLTVKLVGTVSNRSGVGAKVRAQAHYAGESRWQRRDISAGDAWNGNQFYAQFGLGDATTVDTLRIEWPSGIVEEFHNVAARQILTIVEPSLKGAFGTDGSFHLQMSGNTNRTYQISTSADLVNWTALTNCPGPGPGGTVEVSDPAAGQSQRFYRLEAP